MAHLCGCYYTVASANRYLYPSKHYLPQVDLSAHTTILSTTSRTVLTQTFINPSSKEAIKECVYTFPLYDGVSVVGFTCRIGSRLIKGIVKEKEKARKVYQEAVERGETAGLVEQLDNSDVFHTKLGNVPAGQKVIVDITYVGELKHDAETDGIRFTVPTAIAPRYGTLAHDSLQRSGTAANDSGGIRITVDASLTEGSFIQGIQSPSHPIAVTMGSTSTGTQQDPQMYKASATLSLGSTELDKDFVLMIVAKDNATPIAFLETHSIIPNQRALMATLVPKFALLPSRPEIIFVADRSGSMDDKIPTLVSALKVFLKSLPVGVKFNICSFGSDSSFLWPKSKAYGQSTLTEALQHVEGFSANCGGTETFAAMKATIESRYKDLPLEVMLLTDGEIWNQEELFSYLNKEVRDSKSPIRVFSLGIGNAVSHALIEGIARAGNGFAQSVGEGEKLESKVVRMLKGGLSPDITDYSLEVKYDKNEDDGDDFEMVECVTDGLRVLLNEQPDVESKTKGDLKPVSLFDTNVDLDKEDIPMPDEDGQGRYDHLPAIPIPSLLQAPHRIPPLFPFTRTTVYLLMGPGASQKTPKAVVLRATSPHGPLELEIPVQVMSEPSETIHQLAARKAVGELEEGRGWIFDARDEKGTLVKDRFESRFDEMVEKEAVRLGVQFQIGGKWCSFVAVEANQRKEEESKEFRLGSRLSTSKMGENSRQAPTRCPRGRPFQYKFSFMSNHVLQADRRMVTGATLGSSLGSSMSPGTPLRNTFATSGSPLFSTGSGAPHTAARKSAPPLSYSAEEAELSDDEDQGFGLFDGPNEVPLFKGGLPPPAAYPHSSPPQTRPRKRKLASTGPTIPESSVKTCAPPGVRFFRSSAPAPPRAASTVIPVPQVVDNDDIEAELEEGSDAELEQVSEAATEMDSLHRIISLQSFEGLWELTNALLRVLKLSRVDAEDKVPVKTRVNVWATVLAIYFLEQKMGDQKDSWELVVEKARVWLGSEGVDEEALGKLYEMAEGLIGG
ncbi:MAG: hypothetical protein M1830_010321 [Pleopsidium flavum]|nr:MAG: hypothetical protein M1830_010321 [Pleopsidium flavum]